MTVFDEPLSGEYTLVEERDPLIGTIFDRRFSIDFRIATGGFGAIYRVTHLRSGTPFALKLLRREFKADAQVVARFRREGNALTALRHPNTVAGYELGETEDGTLFIVMELLRGETLHERLERGPLPWVEMVSITLQICAALDEAHRAGLVHRDLKPANIHLGEDGTIKVLDFGIAKLDDGEALTQVGVMIGTLDYMSPEQMVGGEITARSDIYALGVLMYEAISGGRVFPHADGVSSILGAALLSKPELLSARAYVPRELDQVVMRCLAGKAAERFASVEELARALEDLLPYDGVTVQQPAYSDAFEMTMLDPSSVVPVEAQPQRQPMLPPPPQPISLPLHLALHQPRYARGSVPPQPEVPPHVAMGSSRYVPLPPAHRDQETAVWWIVIAVVVAIAVIAAISIGVS